MEEMSATKKKVFEAAISLFNTKGYNGTSVREIAKQAEVNLSLISYYFGGKKGLLEKLMISFWEGYLSILEQIHLKKDGQLAKTSLLHVFEQLLFYQSKHYHLARLVHREVTVDSFLIREIMTTYLAKEKYYLTSILDQGIRGHEFRKLPVKITMMQIKSMLTMPYLQPQYLVEVLHLHPQEKYFVDHYFKETRNWIESDLCLKTPPHLQLARSVVFKKEDKKVAKIKEA